MEALLLLKNITDSLVESYLPNEARSLGFILIEHFFGLNKTQVISGKHVSDYEFKKFALEAAVDRLQDQEPIQYVLHKAPFLEYEFYVNEFVLIPRPETEELVLYICEKFKNAPNKPAIIDLCTGSGCIINSLAHKLNLEEAVGLDISRKGLEVAKHNSDILDVKVNFINKDLLREEVDLSAFDVVVSNPPYVMHKEKKLMAKNVLDFEPHIALFVEDDNPLIFYKRIVNLAEKSLREGSMLAMEINEQLGNETANLLYEGSFKNIEIIKDINGKDRFVVAYKF